MSDRSGRLGAFAPNERDEKLLKDLNQVLRESGLEGDVGASSNKLPPLLFISFVPRSGSTYLAQILARSRKFHYISNFVARFWMCPDIGLFLQRATGLATLQHSINEPLESRYGVTSHPLDPHEFGFFWRQFIGGEPTDFVEEPYDADRVHRLRESLNRVRACSSMPMFIKNGLAGYNVKFIKHCFPEAKFIHITRDAEQVVRSIYRGRKEIFDDHFAWLSIKPKTLSELQALDDPLDQVYGQVNSIEEHMCSAFAETRADVIQLNYCDVVESPEAIIDQVYTFAMKNTPSENHVHGINDV